MSNILKLATIRVLTQEFHDSKLFIKKLFEISPIEEQDGFASYNFDGMVIDLVEADEKNPASFGGTVPYWEVLNLDQIMTQAKDLGAEVYRGPLLVEETLQKIVQIKSQCGIVIGFEQKIQ